MRVKSAPRMVTLDSPRSTRTGARAQFDVRTVLGLALVTAAIVAAAAYRLRAYPYPLDLHAALHGAAQTASSTVPVALRTWSILAITLATLARWLRRYEPGLAVAEATAGAIALLWGGAYLLLLTLGPAGLYQPTVLRVTLLLVLGAALWASRGRRVTGGRWPVGAWITAAGLALSIVPLLLMQIGSPVPPFMDVLPHVAGPEKIVTFHYYDAFRNDPTGLWAPTRQIVGYDALFSFVALVAGSRGHLAMTSLIVPFAIAQAFALYLTGRTVRGTLTGGLATLFLLQTFIWRRTPDTRGTALAFILVAIGLALLFGRRRSALRTALASLAFGVGLTVNPLTGAAGMQTASAAALIEWLDLARPLLPPVLALAAASLFAVPQVLVSVQWIVPLWLLPVIAASGAACMVALAHSRRRYEPSHRRAIAVGRITAILGIAVVGVALHARRTSELFGDSWFGYGMLFVFALGGIVAMAHDVWRSPVRWPAAAIPALALWAGFVNHAIADPLRFGGILETRSLASEVTTKMMYYWWPYWMAVLAAAWLAVLARRRTRIAVIAFALLFVIYPFRHVEEPVEYDTAQLSLAETWGFHLAHAANGYHGGRPDRRWVLDGQWRELADLLRQEVAAGRIDYYTHIVNIAPAIDTVEIGLGTGISVDLITPQYDPQSIWSGNGRARGMDALPQALAARPRFVVVQGFPAASDPELPNYELLMARPQFRLFRLRDAAPAP